MTGKKKTEQEAVVEEEPEEEVEIEEVEEEEQELKEPTEAQAEVEVAPRPSEPIEFTFRMPAALFQDAVKAINAIVGYGLDSKEVPEVLFNIGENGIAVNKLDKARIAMVSFSLTKQGFEDYTCKKGGMLCFNGNDLINVLRGVQRESRGADGVIKTEGDMLELVCSEPDLTLNLKHSEYNRTFALKAFVPERGDEEIPVPKLTHTVTFKTSVKNLKRIIEDAAKSSDHVKLTAHEKGIAFDTVSEDTTLKYHGDLPKSDKLDEFQMEKEASATYNLDFLSQILKNVPKDATALTCRFSSDMPIQIETGLFEKLHFFMAPRITTE